MDIVLNSTINLNPKALPTFNSEDLSLLRQISGNLEIPERVNALARRIEDFHWVEQKLKTDTTWNLSMPWVLGAIEAVLITATVVAVVFGGPWGLLPFFILACIESFCLTSLTDPKYRGANGSFPPIAAILYAKQLLEAQSSLEKQGAELQQAVPQEIQTTLEFWKSHAQELQKATNKQMEELQKVEMKAAEPGESPEQKKKRLQADKENSEQFIAKLEQMQRIQEQLKKAVLL